MPRKHERKSKKGSWDVKKMKEAVDMVQKGSKLGTAAE